MTYEHEIIFNDDSLQYVTSTTIYLNKEDLEYLQEELEIELHSIKKITSYKI